MGPDAGDRIGNGNQVGKRFLRFDAMTGRIRLVTLDIKAKRRARSTGAGKAQHDARTAFEEDADALILADGLIDRIVIGEIIRSRDLQIAIAGARQRREFFRAGWRPACSPHPNPLPHSRGANNSCGHIRPSAW